MSSEKNYSFLLFCGRVISVIIITSAALWGCSSGGSEAEADTTSLGTTSNAVVTEVETNLQAASSSSGIAVRLQGPSLAISGISDSGLSGAQRNDIISHLKQHLIDNNLKDSDDLSSIMPAVIESFLEKVGDMGLTTQQKKKLLQVITYSMPNAIKRARDKGLSVSLEQLRQALLKGAEKTAGSIDSAGVEKDEYSAAVKDAMVYQVAAFKNAGFTNRQIYGAVGGISRAVVKGSGNLEGIDTAIFADLCEKLAQGVAEGMTNLSSVSSFDKKTSLRRLAYGMAVGFALVDSTVKGSKTTTNLKSWLDTGAVAGDGTLSGNLPDFSDEISAGTTDGENEANGTSDYKVFYHKNNADSGTVPATVTVASGASTTVSGKGSLTKNGHTFQGWNTIADGSGTTYNAGNTVTISDQSIILYAQWKPNAPGTPTIRKGIDSMQISWPAVTGAGSYNVYYNTVENSSTATATGDITAGTSHTITGLTSGTTYYVWVTAKTGTLSSDFSTVNSATTAAIHVATTGNDTSGDGSQGAPYATVQKGIDVANANGYLEVHVQEGTYTLTAGITLKENVSVKGGYSSTDWSRDALNNISKIYYNGTGFQTIVSAGNLTSTIAFDGMAIEANNTNNAYTGIDISNSPYVSITNNRIEVGAGNSSGYGVRIQNLFKAKVANNYINVTLAAPRYNYGIYLGSIAADSDITIINNVINNGLTPVNGAPYTVYATGGGTRNITIRNNTLIAGSFSTGAAVVGIDSSSGTTNLTFDNNIAYCYDANAGSSDSFLYVDTSTVSMSSIKNNVLFDFDQIADIDGTLTADITTLESTYTNASGNISTDIKSDFVNTAGGDWHLSASTPTTVTTGGIDGSASGWEFTDDREKTTRTGNGSTGWSIGAYEKD